MKHRLSQFTVAVGFSACLALALSLLTGVSFDLDRGPTLLLLFACLGYAAWGPAPPADGSSGFGAWKHFFAAIGTCVGAQMLVSLIIWEPVNITGLGLLAILAVSLAHALRVAHIRERRRITDLILYAGAAAFLLPYFWLAPGREQVQADFDRVWEALNQEFAEAPPALVEAQRALFVERALEIPGWSEHLVEHPDLVSELGMLHSRAGAGFSGAGDRVEVAYRFAPITPSHEPGKWDWGEASCVEVDFDLAIAGNTYSPGELRALIHTTGGSHDAAMVQHLRGLLAGYEADIEVRARAQ